MKTRKMLTLGLSMAMVLGLATPAFAAEKGDSKEPTKMTIALRGGNYSKVVESCLADFEKENNVKIEPLELEFDDLHSKISLDAANSKGNYDLVMVDGSWEAEFSQNKVLADLSKEGYKFDDDIIKATEKICKNGDSIYLAPYFGNVTVMLYNKKLIEDAGYKTGEDIKTWEDIQTIAKKTKDAGKNGYIERGGSPDNIVTDFLPILLANGGWVVDDKNKPTVDTKEMKEALKQYIELNKLGQSMDKDDIVAQIDSGKGALAIGWPGWYVPKSDSKGAYTVIPSKLTKDGEDRSTALQGVWCLGVPENSPNKELGVKLLQYLMDKDVQLKTVKNGGVPCRYSCLKNPEVDKDMPQLAIVCDALEKGVYRPQITQWSDFTQILGTELDGIIKGTESMDDGLKKAQDQLNELMSNN